VKTREFEQQARRVAQAAALARIVGPMVRDAISDRKVRAAAGDAFGTGRKVYEDLRGSDARIVASRMARDERLQGEVAALVRSAMNAVDEGIASGRRSARRRMLRFVMFTIVAAGLVGVAMKRRLPGLSCGGKATDMSAPETPTAAPHTQPITN
jgi:hypothetical protein